MVTKIQKWGNSLGLRIPKSFAKEAGVDLFIILTGVERVFKNFGKKNEEPIKVMDINEATRLLNEGQFPVGSMGPKIAASVDYIKGGLASSSTQRALSGVISPQLLS